MFISDEEKGHILIGEATISLIFNREEITPQALSDALQKMADGESDKERVRQIEQVRQWLKRYRQQAICHPTAQAGLYLYKILANSMKQRRPYTFPTRKNIVLQKVSRADRAFYIALSGRVAHNQLIVIIFFTKSPALILMFPRHRTGNRQDFSGLI
ncbi:hypothetical protein [Erwinia oleae]|uniref:hypothetical protein n=1 Tax=Erwinia oleae TaxID=796334 RepID=UPI0006901BBB|nr:hypothetical protein [Erwinia oleae]